MTYLQMTIPDAFFFDRAVQKMGSDLQFKVADDLRFGNNDAFLLQRVEDRTACAESVLVPLGQIGQRAIMEAPKITMTTTALFLPAFGLLVSMLSYLHILGELPQHYQ